MFWAYIFQCLHLACGVEVVLVVIKRKEMKRWKKRHWWVGMWNEKKKRREKLGNMSGALLCLHYQESKLTSFRGREKRERERERLWCVREQHEHASTVIFFCFKLQKNDSLFSSLSFLLSGWTESHTGIERERDKQITKIITKKNGVWHLT